MPWGWNSTRSDTTEACPPLNMVSRVHLDRRALAWMKHAGLTSHPCMFTPPHPLHIHLCHDRRCSHLLCFGAYCVSAGGIPGRPLIHRGNRHTLLCTQYVHTSLSSL